MMIFNLMPRKNNPIIIFQLGFNLIFHLTTALLSTSWLITFIKNIWKSAPKTVALSSIKAYVF